MRSMLLPGIAFLMGITMSCVKRDYKNSDNPPAPKTEVPQNQDGNQNTTGGTTTGGTNSSGTTTRDTIAVVQVNPKAFNAFNIWRDGQGTEILDYPEGYRDGTGTKNPDGVFYDERGEYWGNKFTGEPTEGAKAVNDVLEYPTRNGKQLKLKFTATTANNMAHDTAVTHCKQQGLRLPTVRELFDFCAAGVAEPNYGPNFKQGAYPQSESARCGGHSLWSVSVNSNISDYGWFFSDLSGFVTGSLRSYRYGVRCVGPVQ